MRVSLSCGAWLPVLRSIPASGSVALTFDDGPTLSTTPALLDLLDRHHATATFFLSGVRAMKHPKLVADIVAAGHAVYGHGWEHIQLERTTPARIRHDLDKVERLLEGFRPTPSPYLVRLPYNSGFWRSWVHQAIRKWRLDAQLVHWSISLEDVTISAECDGGAAVEQAVADRIARAMAHPRLDRAILLLHEQPFDVCLGDDTVAPYLAGELLSALDAAGIRVGPVVPQERRNWASRFVLA